MRWLCRCRKKFVTFNTRGHSARLPLRFDPGDAAETMDIDVARLGDFFWQGEHKFDGNTGL